jgi:hypothetical protein
MASRRRPDASNFEILLIFQPLTPFSRSCHAIEQIVQSILTPICMRGPEDRAQEERTMTSTLTRKQLMSDAEKSPKSRELDEIFRERMDQITSLVMVAIVLAYALYVFVL